MRKTKCKLCQKEIVLKNRIKNDVDKYIESLGYHYSGAVWHTECFEKFQELERRMKYFGKLWRINDIGRVMKLANIRV